jgi:hypothetical protein
MEHRDMPASAATPIGTRSGRRSWRTPVLAGLLAIAPVVAHAQGTDESGPGPLPAVNYPHPVFDAAPPVRDRETIWIIDNGVSRPYYYAAGGWLYLDANRRPHVASPSVQEAIAARRAPAGFQPGGFQSGGFQSGGVQSHGLPNTARHPIVTISHASRAAEPPRRR